jgi:hypothetical protein
VPKLLDELMNERCGSLALGGGGPLGRSDAVGGPHPRPPQTLPGHQATDPRCPGQPTGGQLSRLARRIISLRGHLPRLVH